MHLWCCLIPLATTTLNLLRPSQINPKLSDKALLNGAFGYNKTPLAPPSTKVLLHETPNKSGTWAPHGVDGWYVVAAPNHYRFHRIFGLRTHKERIARTMEFFPHNISMSTTLSAYSAIVAAQDLMHALQHPESATPFATIQSNQAAVLATLSGIFHCCAQSAPHPPPVLPPKVRILPALPIISPRVTVTSPGLQLPASAPAACQRQSIIKPNDENPVCHRYHLWSQINIAELLPAQQENSFIKSDTGNVHEYRHLARGRNKAIWIKILANNLGCLSQGVGLSMPKGTNTLYF